MGKGVQEQLCSGITPREAWVAQVLSSVLALSAVFLAFLSPFLFLSSEGIYITQHRQVVLHSAPTIDYSYEAIDFHSRDRSEESSGWSYAELKQKLAPMLAQAAKTRVDQSVKTAKFAYSLVENDYQVGEDGVPTAVYITLSLLALKFLLPFAAAALF